MAMRHKERTPMPLAIHFPLTIPIKKTTKKNIRTVKQNTGLNLNIKIMLTLLVRDKTLLGGSHVVVVTSGKTIESNIHT